MSDFLLLIFLIIYFGSRKIRKLNGTVCPMSICIHLLLYFILILSAYVTMCSEAGKMSSSLYLLRNEQVCRCVSLMGSAVWVPVLGELLRPQGSLCSSLWTAT